MRRVEEAAEGRARGSLMEEKGRIEVGTLAQSRQALAAKSADANTTLAHTGKPMPHPQVGINGWGVAGRSSR